MISLTPAFIPENVNQIANKLGLPFTSEKDTSTSTVSDSVSEHFDWISVPPVELTPIDILDYIYPVLHSSTFRKKYSEF
jgi:hypothetical protein